MKKQTKTPPYKSKLIPYQKEIFRMWWTNKKLKEIKAFLEIQNVQISLQGIAIFIKRRNKRPSSRYIPDHLKYLLEDDKTKTPEDNTVAKPPTPEKPKATTKDEKPDKQECDIDHMQTPQEWRLEKARERDEKGL